MPTPSHRPVRRARVAVALFVSVLLAWSAVVPVGAQEVLPVLTMSFPAFGQGDAAVYRAGCGEQMVIDAGEGSADGLIDVLARSGDRHVDYAAASHADADHIGDFVSMFIRSDTYAADVIIDGFLSPADHDSATFERYWAHTRDPNLDAELRVVDIGDTVVLCPGDPVNAVTFEVVSVGYDGTAADGLPVTDPNDKGVCWRISTAAGFVTASCGDINGTDGGGRADVESAVADAIGDVDVVKVNHHGSFFSSNGTWIDTLDADLAVITVGANDFGHPQQVVVDDYVASGAAVMQTLHGDGHPQEGEPADGTIVVTVDDTGFWTATGSESHRRVDADTINGPGPVGTPQPNSDTVTVTDAADPHRHALDVSATRFPSPGDATHAIIASADGFADSLAGTSLAGTGPLLLLSTIGDEFARQAITDELDRLFPDGGTVYVLGGTAAVGWEPPAPHTTVRLAGPTRIETAVAVAEQALALNPDATQIGLARAFGTADNPATAFADSVTAGGWTAETTTPLLLTPTETVHPAVEAFLADHPNLQPVLLGGEAALSSEVEGQLDDPVRVAGPTRDTTAIAIADQLWEDPTGARIVIDGYHTDGWTWGLVAAGRAADLDAPILITSPDGLLGTTRDQIAGLDGGVDLTGAFTDNQAAALAEQAQAAVDSRTADPGNPTNPDTPPNPDEPADPDAPGGGGGQVRIATILYNPDGDDVAPGGGEYVQLVNDGAGPVDVSGWYLTDLANHRLDIPAGVTIPPGGGILRVHTGTGTNTATAVFAGEGQAVWNNSGGDTATLHTAGGDPVDTYTYTS